MGLQDKQVAADKVKYYMYGKELEMVRYLVRILRENGNDTKSIQSQVKRAWIKWNVINIILKWESENFAMLGNLYMAVAHVVILYGIDSWTVSKWD